MVRARTPAMAHTEPLIINADVVTALAMRSLLRVLFSM